MQTYKSEKTTIPCNIHTVWDKLSNPAIFKAHIEQNASRLPEEARANLDKVLFDEEGISIESPMGQLRLAIDREQSEEPKRIVFSAADSPIKFNLAIDLQSHDEYTTESVTALQLDLPIFLRAMVGNQLEAGAKKFGELLAVLPYENL
ncbi:MAG: hypothetical protein IJ808_03525 [Muribaculaceae bacterium]|nr:hypothetical protein [Muribaculaceae bacterium]